MTLEKRAVFTVDAWRSGSYQWLQIVLFILGFEQFFLEMAAEFARPKTLVLKKLLVRDYSSKSIKKIIQIFSHTHFVKKHRCKACLAMSSYETMK